MKISRLFHWLYALLMALPIIFFLPTCIYYAFNKNAVNNQLTDVSYVYESNEVNNSSDLVAYNIYSFNIQNKACDELFTNQDGYISFKLITTLEMEPQEFVFEYELNYIGNIEPDIYLEIHYNGDIILYLQEEDLNNGDFLTEVNYYGDFQNNCIIQYYDSDFINADFLSYTDYNEIDEVIINNVNTIPQQINFAWSSVWELPLFSWTHTSFVSVPFSYISGLFGVAQNSTLNYTLTYFASVSMIWLVFDLLMYVPLLCHRWLDKGIVE